MHNAAWLAEQPSDNIIMITSVSETEIPPDNMIILSVGSTTPSSTEEDRIIWLIDSAASNHISGNKNLFHSMHNIAPVRIDIANGKYFTANQRGTIRIKITSDPQWDLPDVPHICTQAEVDFTFSGTNK
jgi:Pol polyprotein, beta-barrel domain